MEMMKRNELNTITWNGYDLHTTVSIYILRDETKLERGKISPFPFYACFPIADKR